MAANRALLQLDEPEPRPSTSFELDTDSNDAETLSQLFPDEVVPSRLVLPTPGFCLKTLTTGPSKKKIFINVCHTDGIPPPRDLSLAELTELWSSDEVGNYRVPMSIAAPREERDCNEMPCDVYDVAISSAFYEKVENDAVFRTFLIQVVVEGVANKFNVGIAVGSGVTILKKRKAMGNIQTHRVRIRSASSNRKLIEEVSTSGVPQGPVLPICGIPQGPIISGIPQVPVLPISIIPQGYVLPNFGIPQGPLPPIVGVHQGPVWGLESSRYVLKVVPGELGRTLVGAFRIPDVFVPTVGSNDLKLQLGWDRMRIEATSIQYLVDIFIPFLIDTEHAVAMFNCITFVLTVTVPVLNYDP